MKIYKYLLFLFSLFILGCSQNRTPEEVVWDYTTYMSEGKCEEAKELCTGGAEQIVQGSIDAGCNSYTTRIDSVTCIINVDTANCWCYEYRDFYGSMKFPYVLQKFDNEWKLTKNVKDTGFE